MGTACFRLERADVGVAACSLERARSAEVISFGDSGAMLYVSLGCRTVAVSVTYILHNNYISVLCRLITMSVTDLRCCTPVAQSRFDLIDQSSQLLHQRNYWVPIPRRLNPQFLHIDQ